MVGYNFAVKLPNIWLPNKELYEEFDALRPATNSLSANYPAPRSASGIPPFVYLLASVVIFFIGVGIGTDSTAWIFVLSSFSLGVIWIIKALAASGAKSAAATERLEWLHRVAVFEASAHVEKRRLDARSHDPSIRSSSVTFTPAGNPPLPQPYGVSHEGAEALCAEWMRFYGEADAEVTRFTSDGGIDVTSLHYIAQVKNYAGTVGVESIREMAGTALDDGRKALFFTSGTYASGALSFADRIGMPLFIYDAVAGTLTGANAHAESIFSTGL